MPCFERDTSLFLHRLAIRKALGMSASADLAPQIVQPKRGLALLPDAFGYTMPMYIQGVPMQVSKWGNSLAIRLPAAIVQALELKEGDDIEIRVAGSRELEVGRDESRKR